MNNKRLLTILSLIEDNSNIIDVGCDHGYLSILIQKYKKNVTVVASDISKNALSYAINNIEKENLTDIIKVQVNNGIKDISTDINSAIIAGMGTHTIIDILNNGKDELKHLDTLYICSHNNEYILRKEVIKLGFYIHNEKIIVDNKKTYIIIVFKKGNINYTKEELMYGPILLQEKTPEFINYLNKQIKILKLKVEHDNKKNYKNILDFLQKEIG